MARRVFPWLFVIGVVLMVPFDRWFTRLAGMTFLVAFVVVGLFVIATPEFLAGDAEDDDQPGGAPGTGIASDA
jgi:Ca2+/Na+ antiporter